MLGEVHFNQTKLRDIALSEISDLVLDPSNEGFSGHVHFLAASSIVAASENQEINKILNSGISLCDSAPLGAVLRVTNSKFRNIRGSDFLREVLLRDNGTKGHFFIVSEETVFNSLFNFARGLNPVVKFVGSVAPDYAEDFKKDYPEWEHQIFQSNAEIIWVGLGSPKQDFIAHHLSEATGKTCIAVGAALEFVSGVKNEAPKFFQFLYLEWLFRLLQDPRRLFSRYTIGNAKFLVEVAKHLWALRRFK